MNIQAKGKPKRKSQMPLSRIGVGAGAVTLAGATGYMNVSAWVAQAGTRAEQVINGCISGSLEAVGAAGLAWAGYQLSKKRPLRAVLAAAAAGGAIYFNTGASQNYYEAQELAAQNEIERSHADVAAGQSEIARLQSEIAGLIEQNDGRLPRPFPAIEAAYSHLDPAKNPINMARKETEAALRREYERLQGDIAELRADSVPDMVHANDTVRPVIAENQRLVFIWAVEVFKGGAFFLLGTDRLGNAFKRASQSGYSRSARQPATPVPANDGRPALSDAERKRRQRFAIMRAKGAFAKRR